MSVQTSGQGGAPADSGDPDRGVVSLRRTASVGPVKPVKPPQPTRQEKREQARQAAINRPRRPGPRGWVGRGKGTAELVQAAGEWRGTTVQVCGMWPFAAGTGAPLTGVPLGPHLQTGETVCGDPISWFMRAKLISNPSMFALGLPGLGKSTLIRRMCLGLHGYGVLPLVLADLKPDYVDLIRALNGQVIQLGRSTGGLNVLDPGEATEVAARLTGAAREAVLIEAHARKVELLKAFISIVRKAPVQVEEGNVLARAINILDDRSQTVPLLPDLLDLVHQAPNELRMVANDRGDVTRYHDIVRQLEASLFAMCSPDGPIGDVFARPTAVHMRRDKPVCIDVSSIRDTEADLQGAALLACWSAGFASVNYHHLLADAGLERRRHFFLVMDELWRALRSGPEMVDRIDGLTRLNRNDGVGQALCTHTMSDLLSLSTEAERLKAFGFVERAGMVVTAGLPAKELPLLAQAGLKLSGREAQMVNEWSAPATFDVRTGREGDPPGRGKFLIRVGSRPGIPIKLTLTEAEMALNDTNKRWK